MKRITTLLILLINLQSFAQSKVVAKNGLLAGLKDFKLEIQTGYKDLSGPVDKASIFNFQLSALSKIDLGYDFILNTKLNLSHESGSTRAKFDETRYAPNSKFGASYAYLSYNILELIELEVGSLNNTDMSATSELITSGPTALGFREQISFENDYFKINANATQSKPSNDELSSRLDRDETGTPRFYSEFLNLEFNLYEHKLGLRGAQFAYENLSSASAYTDQFSGNTILGNTETNAQYAYKFKGRLVEAYIDMSLTDIWSLNLRSAISKNNSAQAQDRDANFIKVSSKTKFEECTFEVSATKFKMESDATVSFYNQSEMKNNYEGSIYNFSYVSANNFNLKFEYVDRKVNEASIYLSNEQIYKISIRKTYDLF